MNEHIIQKHEKKYDEQLLKKKKKKKKCEKMMNKN